MKLTEKTFMLSKKILAVSTLVLLTACGGNKEVTQTIDDSTPVAPLSDQLVLSTLWFQNSSEANYIYRELYLRAEEKMTENLKKYKGSKPSVILDIDETVLNNSAYEARLIKQGADYNPESWDSWVKEANAPLLPGVLPFLRKAESLGVEVFYISNRSVEMLQPTMENLQKYELPFVDPEHVLLREDEPLKFNRREKVKSKSHVLLYVGDQLTDFSEDMDQMMMENNPSFNKVMRDSIAQYFVLLPNPMYGSFEQKVYNGQKLNDAQKSEARKQALRTRQGDR